MGILAAMYILYKLLEIFDGHAISGMSCFIHVLYGTNNVSSYTYIMYTCTYFSQTSSNKLTFSTGGGVTELLQQSEQYWQHIPSALHTTPHIETIKSISAMIYRN